MQKKLSYWQEKKLQKRKSRLKTLTLCRRCEELRGNPDGVDRAAEVSKADYDSFRKEISVIRKQKAVVILTVDAVNFEGTLIRNLRDYVGGNPIVVAIARCDLLPSFDAGATDALVDAFAARCEMLQVAAVHLTAIPPFQQGDEEYGLEELARSVAAHRGDRDVYIVGAANIGKSTLTKALTRCFIHGEDAKGDALTRFDEGRTDQLRLQWLRETEGPTGSPLPGAHTRHTHTPHTSHTYITRTQGQLSRTSGFRASATTSTRCGTPLVSSRRRPAISFQFRISLPSGNPSRKPYRRSRSKWRAGSPSPS